MDALVDSSFNPSCSCTAFEDGRAERKLLERQENRKATATV
jgi:hypothetical protein